MKEYLTSIGARKKWNERERNVNKGGVVLVIDQTCQEDSGRLGTLWRPIQEQMDLFESLMSRLPTVHTEDQFRGFLCLNSKTKKTLALKSPRKIWEGEMLRPL